MINTPDTNRIRIAVERVIVRHELDHSLECLQRMALPPMAEAIIGAGVTSRLAATYRARVDALAARCTATGGTALSIVTRDRPA